MALTKRYVLRLFISIKYITANVIYRNCGRIVATSSVAEHDIKQSLECGRSCNAKVVVVVGEVLARWLKVEGLSEGQGGGIHVNVNKEVQKKRFKSKPRFRMWNLSHNHLDGPLSAEFGNLRSIQIIDMSFNNFRGTFH